MVKINVKIRSNKDGEMQLIKSSERKKKLLPSDILLSNLALNSFMIQAIINKLADSDNTVQLGDKYLLLLTPVDADKKTKIESELFRENCIHLNCYQPNVKFNKYGIKYNQESKKIEFGALNTDKKSYVSSTLTEIDKVVEQFIDNLCNKKAKLSFISFLNHSYVPEKEILICDNEEQLSKAQEMLF